MPTYRRTKNRSLISENETFHVLTGTTDDYGNFTETARKSFKNPLEAFHNFQDSISVESEKAFKRELAKQKF